MSSRTKKWGDVEGCLCYILRGFSLNYIQRRLRVMGYTRTIESDPPPVLLGQLNVFEEEQQQNEEEKEVIGHG